MTKQQLLAEVEDLLRSMPSREAFQQHRDAETLPWLGRAAAAIEKWDVIKSARCALAVTELQHTGMVQHAMGYTAIKTLLYQARADLRMDVGQLSIAVDTGDVFNYFDEVRKVVETARDDVFFVDPYLDADFVSRYLPHVASGAAIRLLAGRKKTGTLLPAVDMFTTQFRRSVEVRSTNGIHDRYLFVDKAMCFLSGASFKDGAKNAPAVIAQIADAFPAMLATYEALWNSAKVER